MPNERIAWLALFVVIILTGVIRLGLMNVPLERDEGEYAYAGQLILQGIPPYQEVYNMKFPGIYAAYAILMAIFGETSQGIHFGLLIINAITIVLVFLLAKKLVNSLCAVISAATFAILSIGQPVQGIWANSEHFVILFATGGLLLMLRALELDSLRKLFAAGLLLGLSFAMKQHGLAFSVLAVFYITYYSLRKQPLQWRQFLSRMISFASGVSAIFLFICLIMIWTGVFKNFWFWTFDYASAYISQIPIKYGRWLFKDSFLPIFHTASLLWIFVVLGLFTQFTNRISEKSRVFLLLFFIFSALSICPGFYFRPHYFILLLPCASIYAGVTISWIAEYSARLFSKQAYYLALVFLIIVGFFLPVYKQREFLFHMTNFQICRSTYGQYGLNPFYESIKIADFIKKRTNPDDRIAILGSEPQIFFYSKRRSVSPHIYMYPLIENHKFALKMKKKFIDDIELNYPKYVVFVHAENVWMFSSFFQKEIHQWLDSRIYNGNLKLVGVVELLENNTIYYWEPNIKWPVISKYYVAIFMRT
ncbi:MAG: glycosyltransferase family 39 protein [Smithella sp.]